MRVSREYSRSCRSLAMGDRILGYDGPAVHPARVGFFHAPIRLTAGHSGSSRRE
jgi:hypothetical protein